MSETVQQATAASIEAAAFWAFLAQRAASLLHPDSQPGLKDKARHRRTCRRLWGSVQFPKDKTCKNVY